MAKTYFYNYICTSQALWNTTLTYREKYIFRMNASTIVDATRLVTPAIKIIQFMQSVEATVPISTQFDKQKNEKLVITDSDES